MFVKERLTVSSWCFYFLCVSFPSALVGKTISTDRHTNKRTNKQIVRYFTEQGSMDIRNDHLKFDKLFNNATQGVNKQLQIMVKFGKAIDQ